jgi:hypothetical protein
MKTIINWTRFYGDNKPSSSFGWYVVILKPHNYKELEETNRSYTMWIKECGFNIRWYHDGEFWEDHKPITDRVLYYAERPNGLLLEDLDG